MSNEWLEKFARSLAGETLSSGAAGLGAGIGYARAGGKFADIPDVMREEIEAFKQRTQPKSKNEQDAMEVLTALSVLPARLNPLGVAGHTIDFLKAAPEMLQAKLSGAEPQTGEIMQGGLKRRLAKGGAQAEYALKQRAARIDDAIGSDYLRGGQKAARMGLEQPLGGYGSTMSQSGMRAIERTDRKSMPIEYFDPEMQKFINYLDKKKLNAPMEYHHMDQAGKKAALVPFYEPEMLQQIKTSLPDIYAKSQKTTRPKTESFADIATEAQQTNPQYQMQIDKAKFMKMMDTEPEMFAQWKKLRDEADLARRQGNMDQANKIDQQKNQLVKTMSLTADDIQAIRKP